MSIYQIQSSEGLRVQSMYMTAENMTRVIEELVIRSKLPEYQIIGDNLTIRYVGEVETGFTWFYKDIDS